MKRIALFLVIVATPISASATSYNYEYCVFNYCGEADRDGDVDATDALVALKEATSQTIPSGNGCKLDAGDVAENFVATFIRSAHHADGGFQYEGSRGVDLGNSPDCAGADVIDSLTTAVTATDVSAITQIATGNSSNIDPDPDCLFTIIDRCPEGGTSDYGDPQDERDIVLDDPNAGGVDGKTCEVFVRELLDNCPDYTTEVTCEDVSSGRNQYCNWVFTGGTFKCVGNSARIRKCLDAQEDLGLN